MSKMPSNTPSPFMFRGVADREIDGDRMTETLECGHKIFFNRQRDNAGQGRWYDEEGRGVSLQTKTRRCWQCETERQ